MSKNLGSLVRSGSRLLGRNLNKHTAYEEAAKDWEGDFLLIITPGEGLDREYMFLSIYGMESVAMYIVPNRTSKTATFVFEGSYENWKKLIRGELNPI
jgi:putative sterol carrier protein